MWIAFDLTLIAIIGLTTFLGYKQGLVKSAIKMLSFFIAIIVALVLYKPISNVIIKNTSIDDGIKNTIIEKVKPENLEEQDREIEKSVTNKIIEKADETIEETAKTFSVKIIEMGVLLILYISVKIGLKFITALADIIAKLPILKQINKTGRNSVWIN